MYIAVYSKDIINNKRNHLTNLSNINYNLVRRAFDFESFSATGYTVDDFSKGLVYVLNDDNGHHIYSGFCKNVSVDGKITSNKKSFKGDDFRRILDTEVLLDFSQNVTQDYTLSGIFRKVVDLVENTIDSDPLMSLFDLQFIIPTDTTDTTVIGDYTGTYFIKNAYEFLKTYLSYYNYYIYSYYNVVTDKIVFEFKHNSTSIDIKLKDFINSRTTTDISLNKAIATLSYNTTDDQGNLRPRPIDLPMKVYYLGRDNEIYEDTPPVVSNREYPIRCKIFENEYLSQAQYDAVSELVNSRYSEDIRVTNDLIYNPLDLTDIELYTIVNVYTDDGFYKSLPVSEIDTTYKLKEKKDVIKLGFKKVLLTEIIKGGNRNA